MAKMSNYTQARETAQFHVISNYTQARERAQYYADTTRLLWAILFSALYGVWIVEQYCPTLHPANVEVVHPRPIVW